MSDLDELLQENGPPALLYALCRALGLSRREAAEHAGFSIDTGRRCEGRPWWPGVVEMMRAQFNEADPALLPLLPDVIRTYRAALEENDKSVARDVLDRMFGKPGARRAVPQSADTQNVPPLVIYRGMGESTDNDLS